MSMERELLFGMCPFCGAYRMLELLVGEDGACLAACRDCAEKTLPEPF